MRYLTGRAALPKSARGPSPDSDQRPHPCAAGGAPPRCRVFTRVLQPCLVPLTLAAVLLPVASCASGPPLDADFSDTVADYDRVVELPFVTNRAIEIESDDERYFGNEVGGLAAGVCSVGISDDDDGEGDLLGVRSHSVLSIFGQLEPDPRAGIVVYLHGYYEDFERSCRRAATLKQRLGIDEGFLLFSWPANSTPLTYGDDVRDLERSTPALLRLLDDLGQRFGEETISVIAHSLGSRGAVATIRDWPESGDKFHQLVLVAADIDRSLFVESLPDLQEHVQTITVLVSDRDRALLVSETVNREPRLGQSDDVIIEGVELFNVTEIGDTHFSGHIYHLRNAAVVAIIRRALLRGRDDGENAE